MKLRNILLAAASIAVVSCSQPAQKVIKTPVPPRPAGQESMLQFAAEPIADVGIGVVGLGDRGSGAVHRLSYVPGSHIAAICDVEPDRAEKNLKVLQSRGMSAKVYAGDEEVYKQLCEDPDVDLVYICTDWIHHVPVALYAMEHGKHVALEVPSAETLEACWDLVNTSERTRKHCMILENCCYDFFELTALTMAQQGVFGDIIHVEGSYHHNLDPYWSKYWRNWRLEFNEKHRGDLYPTHGFGPIAQALNIHRGDRMKTLVSVDTKSFNGAKIVENHTGEPCTDFKNGDQTCTLIRTENGKTMLIEHDVMTPRPYSRLYQLVGTDGYASKYPVELYCLREYSDEAVNAKAISDEKIYMDREMERLQADYRSVILTPELEALAKKVGGHGGMDFIMDYRLIYCLNNGLPLDMDVYDMAEWCCIAPLSALSLENGNVPVEIPDFTRGAWNQVNGFSYALK